MIRNKKRQKLSLIQITNMFPNDNSAENWFIENRWPNGIVCPICQSLSVKERNTKQRSWRCRKCLKDFSTKTNTLMQGSNLGFRVWAIAIYLMTTSLKGIASTKLASDLGITQKSAWHLAMRIRETYKDNRYKLFGIVEVDETYVGGKEKNKHASKKMNAGRGGVGKQAVIGAKKRDGNIKAQLISETDQTTMQEFVVSNVEKHSNIVTDEHKSYAGLSSNYTHYTVCHSAGEYVNEQAHINGIESFWALLKRGYHGTHHWMSYKHLGQYVNEFAGRHNVRQLNTKMQMSDIMHNMVGKQLRYKDLVASC